MESNLKGAMAKPDPRSGPGAAMFSARKPATRKKGSNK